jgi:hypothetical protein
MAMRKSPQVARKKSPLVASKSPHPLLVVSSRSLKPWTVTVSVSSHRPHRPGSSIEVCEGTNDHHCRLSRRGYLPGRRRDLPEAPGLPADLTAGLRRLKLATMRELAPELRLTAKTQRWAADHPASRVRQDR